jgi:hypothetical protein
MTANSPIDAESLEEALTFEIRALDRSVRSRRGA